MIVEDSRHRFIVINPNDSSVAIGQMHSLPAKCYGKSVTYTYQMDHKVKDPKNIILAE